MHKKLLLVFDDYTEMIRTQTDLMKIGFDVIGIVNEARMADQLLAFNPDVVLAAGRGGKVSAVSVAQKLKENSRFTGKVLVMLPPLQRPSVDELSRIRMDAMVENPCPIGRLITVLARLLQLDAEQLIEKYRRARAAEGASPEELKELVKSAGRDRASRYEKYLKDIEMDSHKTTFDRTAVKAQQENLKKGWDFNKLGQLDELKKRFVSALFKK